MSDYKQKWSEAYEEAVAEGLDPDSACARADDALADDMDMDTEWFNLCRWLE